MSLNKKGYVLIAYDDYKEAMYAIEKANGSKLLDQKIHCDFAFIKPPSLNHNKKPSSQRIGFKKLPPNRHHDRSRSPPRGYNWNDDSVRDHSRHWKLSWEEGRYGVENSYYELW